MTDLIPVAPACHYASGGVATDLHGQSSVPGLFACGEVACSGVHGANRLASNSLLEGLVFSRRIAARLAEGLPERQQPVEDARPEGLVPGEQRAPLQSVMTERAGVLRSETGLEDGIAALATVARGSGGSGARGDQAGVPAWETTNLLTVSRALVEAALLREETRGSHWREDHPERDDADWSVHIDVTLVDGVPRLTTTPLREPETAGEPT